jgi:hypothetical protein
MLMTENKLTPLAGAGQASNQKRGPLAGNIWAKVANVEWQKTADEITTQRFEEMRAARIPPQSIVCLGILRDN